MLSDSLRFVQGAVARKDFIPALTHFMIEDGTIRGFNGVLALCSPIDCDINCKPFAPALKKAIENCRETVKLKMTPAGRLSISSGKFNARIDCITGDTPHALPEGEHVVMDGEALIDALEALDPFIGDDASRPWSSSVLLAGKSAFATNNVTLAEYWMGFDVPRPIGLPAQTVREILRINDVPIDFQLTDTSITFHYEGNRWLRSQLFSVAEWPDLTKVLDKESNPVEIDPEIFSGLETLKPFVDKLGRVIFKGDGTITTHKDEAEGASYEVPGFNSTGIYSLEMLMLLEDRVEMIDWSLYPKPCLFFGQRLRGAIIGMRDA